MLSMKKTELARWRSCNPRNVRGCTTCGVRMAFCENVQAESIRDDHFWSVNVRKHTHRIRAREARNRNTKHTLTVAVCVVVVAGWGGLNCVQRINVRARVVSNMQNSALQRIALCRSSAAAKVIARAAKGFTTGQQIPASIWRARLPQTHHWLPLKD